ncbi:hypothetical protein MHYMCMPSP_00180 [Hyalomma marginatum]|uniref:Uncharacterized protein n=1 Tax=Hyalomma marginatum TaxID=34627 RepID=A0A8S4BXA6_9ACAR|nr:hypothetical protein MHYMCMPSP_00180 [Hyalomma marginatum]CAG7593719.1 hypothetical protein MHYMCMPASI_00708 [Hyalomma marginatum]
MTNSLSNKARREETERRQALAQKSIKYSQSTCTSFGEGT